MMLNEEEFYDAVETALDKHDEEDDDNNDLVMTKGTLRKIPILLHPTLKFSHLNGRISKLVK